MNFYLNDRPVEFELDNRELKFYPNDHKIEFLLNATQDILTGDQWILSTGYWNDSEYWDDLEYWKDLPNG